MTPKIILVESGNNTVPYETTASTIGELFNNSFRQEFNFSDRAIPTISGADASDDREIVPEMTVGARVGASSKSA